MEFFGFDFIDDLASRCRDSLPVEEILTSAGPYCPLTGADGSTSAGCIRLWSASASPLVDRMIHIRLQADPVDTQLFFLFGRSPTAMPHFHAQVVQFAPDACVYNADFLARLDPVEHPDYFARVFEPLSKPYWRAINDPQNKCAMAPANPAIAAYLTPWSIGVGQPTNRAELDRVAPQIHAFLDHYLDLARSLDYPIDDAHAQNARDRAHLDNFFADRLDRRAWNGVYGLIGEDAGRHLKDVLKTSLS
ncbi:MAG: hypothetical protein KJO76_05075 [Gammaproteobacteria bacterium]|nr:hypothetical protein [Gammaproteobacteria bacterium]MBT8443564.1 hypothetical protein [Gammaproteobacteria bacterium]NND36530.1 hypothetical protein [Gammaproteobacteria bacterium]